VLAFGATLARVYERWGWGDRAFVWHEGADTRRFHPPLEEGERSGLVWIGNWGDGERSDELVEYLLKPAEGAQLSLDIFGVRYPDQARRTLQQFGARYHGWLPNAAAPEVFARHLATAHVPRKFYTRVLPGIPTIRVFEALACGIPLVSAPWEDCEQLFRVGQDFLMVSSGAEMTRALTDLKNDAELRLSLVRSGLETVRARHTCAHRVDELLAIVERLRAPVLEPVLESAA
jgi:spore maturation protein CgeB